VVASEVAFDFDLAVHDLVLSGRVALYDNQFAHTHDNLGKVDVVVGTANESLNDILADHKKDILAPPLLAPHQVFADLCCHFGPDLDFGT